MKPKGKKTGFTIIELLTVMSIIVILLSLLLPSLNKVRQYAKFVTQKNQLRNIDSGLQAFEADFKELPDSGALDADNAQYCGAMKLAEAMAGQDGLGFHSDSKFKADDGAGPTELYPPSPGAPGSWPAWYIENLRKRREYLEAKDVQICSLQDLYGSSVGGGFTRTDQVALLCDVYKRSNLKKPATGEKLGMPILYYKADSSKLVHDVNNPDDAGNIYNYKDNHLLLKLGLPWDQATKPPLYQVTGGLEGQVFYEKTLDKSVLPIERPHNKDSYILISAGWDGIYGTADDVFNFAQ
ncbi:MAG: prepilin-type N-terminal cleavage/methylation domain-containing protein [Sedimentisphaerales bacterium]